MLSRKDKNEYKNKRDRRVVMSAVKTLEGNDDAYIFEEAAEDLLSKRGTPMIPQRMYALLSGILKKHGYRLGEETLKAELSAAQDRRPFDNHELYCVNNCMALIIFREFPSLSEAQISGCAYTLAALRSTDFENFFYELSASEQYLCRTYEVYKRSDVETKALYREKIEKAAREHGVPEFDEIRKNGLPRLSNGRTGAGTAYFISLISLSVLLFIIQMFMSRGSAAVPLLLILPTYCLSKQISDLVFSKFPVSSAHIPKYDTAEVPDYARTLCVITGVLRGGDEDEELFGRLETVMLGNRDRNIRFGILADLPDSDENISPADESICFAAQEHIGSLNLKYGENFCLFLRRRTRSQSEKKYIGWERKRGALLELVRKIKGGETTFAICTCDPDFLRSVKYVITLDSDTELGMGKAKKLIGAMLHPENRPVIKGGRVVSGYGVMQPNISASLLSENASDFSMLLCGGGGNDIYSSSSFDVYQNLFGEGNFCGKGIFDIDCYYSLLDRAFEEETVLSHDLLEGTRLRTAYLSDIYLYDGCPSGVLQYFKRQHRWIRGDTQALAYVRRRVKGSRGAVYVNPASPLSLYKLTDNICRALGPVASVAAILICGLIGTAALNTAIAFSLLGPVFPALNALIFSMKNLDRRFFSEVLPGAKRSFVTAVFNISSLFHSAAVSADAVIRGTYRIAVSHKKTLEWTTASEADKLRGGFAVYTVSFIDSIAAGLLCALFYPYMSVKLLGLMWLLFPYFALAISKKKNRKKRISASGAAVLAKYAFDMYKFFAENVGDGDNFLPPDNVQFESEEKTAHRSSPTNIGLYLLSVLAARDFGFIDSVRMCRDIKNTLHTVGMLKKYRGQLYNWYDTETLEVIGQPFISTVDCGNFCTSLLTLKEGLYEYLSECPELSCAVTEIDSLLSSADFSFLYNEKKKLFCISFDTVKGEQSKNCYDMLMSEYRTTGYYCIARGIVPPEHWAKLSRTAVSYGGFAGLLSWGGTAFEYFMPALFLPVYKNSLQYEALRFAAFRQSRAGYHGIYGKSESAYYAFDGDMNYQYKTHGAASLGLAPGLAAEKVYAPYASFLFLAVSPYHALENLSKMKDMGLYGRYGFYEAVDMTPERCENPTPVRSYMSHHAGMSIIACANACFDNVFSKRFMRDKRNAASRELLEERIPENLPVRRKVRICAAAPQKMPLKYAAENAAAEEKDGSIVRAPLCSILSNGKLSLRCSSDGSILIRLRDRDICGREFGDIFSYGGLRLYFGADGRACDATGESCMIKSSSVSVKYRFVSEGIRAQSSFYLSGNSECIAAELSVTGAFSEIRPMLCFEPRLCRDRDYRAHPAFTKLFIESSFDRTEGILYFTRRGRSPLCVAVAAGGKNTDIEFITCKQGSLPLMYGEDDMKALIYAPFGNVCGSAPDPFCAVRRPDAGTGGRYRCGFLIAAAESPTDAAAAIRAARRERNGSAAAFEKSMYECVKRRMYSAGLNARSLKLSSVMLSCICYEAGGREPAPRYFGRSEVYVHGVSGDLPIICAAVGGAASAETEDALCADFISAHRYLQLSGEPCDLVFLCREQDAYGSRIASKLRAAASRFGNLPGRGSVYVVDGEAEVFRYLSVLYADLSHIGPGDDICRKLLHAPQKRIRAVCRTNDNNVYEKKEYGYSGSFSGTFTAGGFICRKNGLEMPHTFCYCGPCFGTVLGADSAGFTYFENSREKRVTPWSGDPYHETGGERLLMYSEGSVFDLCACAGKVYFSEACAIYGGNIGAIKYKVFIGCDVRLYAKPVSIELFNAGKETAEVEICYEHIAAMSDSAVPRRLVIKKNADGESFEYNAMNCSDGRCMFCFDIGGRAHRIAPGAQVKCGFVLGVCHGPDGADHKFIRSKYRSVGDIERAFTEYALYWKEMLSGIKLKSGQPGPDLLVNRYALYQTAADRLFARCGFYQPGGAYGLRDQLQDSLAFLPSHPQIAMRQLARCFAHQYREGDFMHWWHTDGCRSNGVRTRISDDPVWPAYALAEYLTATGDAAFAGKKIAYIESPPLEDGEKDRYEPARRSAVSESVYMHAVRGLESVLSHTGKHGLPLFRGGDWNDGMDNVGDGGESVWLAMFLCMTLKSFSVAAHFLGDTTRAERFARRREELLGAIEDFAFEDVQYLRGFFGDGRPFGSPDDTECSTDLTVQAFAGLCGCRRERRDSSFAEAARRLFDPDSKLLLLLDPPFDGLGRSPGYISDYPPGVRENGGEYCHAACFFAYALFDAGFPDAGFEALCTVDPISRYSDHVSARTYCGEPYAVAGDILASPAFRGRAGWTHYTGSAGWYFRTVYEKMLGIKICADHFSLHPSLPEKIVLPISFELNLRKTRFTVLISSGAKASCKIDKNESENRFYFDGGEHFVEITVEKKTQK